VGCDLTLATTRVLSHGEITGTMGDGVSVEGQTSGATGTVIHCTASQILLTVTGGTFQSGEQIFRVEDSDYVVSSTGPADVVAVAEMGTTGAAITTKWELDNWTTSPTNYLVIRAQSGHEAQLPLDTGRFYFDFTINGAGNYGLMLKEAYLRLENIQINFTVTAASGVCVGLDIGYSEALPANAHDIRITDCVMRVSGAYAGTVYGMGLRSNGGSFAVTNCVVDGADNDASSACFHLEQDGGNQGNSRFYNNTAYGGTYGVLLADAETWKGRNNIADTCGTDDFSGTFDNWEYNMSSDATAPGGDSVTSADADFDNAGTGDFHIGASSDALGAGIGPGSDSNVPATDFEGTVRSGASCDMGADED